MSQIIPRSVAIFFPRPFTKYTKQNHPPANYRDTAFQNVGHHPAPQNFLFATYLPVDKDSDNDLPLTHKILETVARRTMKVAGARRLLSESKGKEKLASMASQSGNGKRRATSPLGHTVGKKQHGHTSGAHNYSSEDIDALFNILEETLPLGGHAWNSAGDDFTAWAQENGRPSRTAKFLKLKFKQVRKNI